MTKRKGDFRSKIDSILAEGEAPAPGGAKIARVVAPTTETKTDKIEVGKVYLPEGRRPDQDVSELLSSVRSRGVMQPILVRPVGGRFEVVDGARRLVAAQQTGRKTVPAVVQSLSAAEARAIASKDRPIVARSTRASRAAAAAAAGTAAASKPAAKTMTASKAKASGQAPAKAPARVAATTATAVATKAAASASMPAAAGASGARAIKPAAPSRARKGARVRPSRGAIHDAGVPIFGGTPPPEPNDAAGLRPAATAPARRRAADAASAPASSRASFPRLPVVEEPEGRVAAASTTAPAAAAADTGPRLSRTRAIAGWYVFLAVLAVASFSLTNLAINHDTTLSVESGAVAGVGLVAVVILLVTGQ